MKFTNMLKRYIVASECEMKNLKYYHAVACTCERTNRMGDFIIDIGYFKNSNVIESFDNWQVKTKMVKK